MNALEECSVTINGCKVTALGLCSGYAWKMLARWVDINDGEFGISEAPYAPKLETTTGTAAHVD